MANLARSSDIPGNLMDLKDSPVLKTTVAATISGFATRTLTHPLDVIKINFQIQKDPISHQAKEGRFRGIFHATRQIAKDEGFLGYFKGHNPGQMLSITYAVCQFTLFEFLKKELQIIYPRMSKSQDAFLSGYVAGSFATIISYPFDLCRTRLIAQWPQKTYTNTFQCLRVVYQNEGFAAIYRGLVPTLIQVGPYSGSMFLAHHFMTTSLKLIPFFSSGEDLTATGNLVAGSVAGLVGKTVVYPLDLGRHRIQALGMEGHRGTILKVYTSKNIADLLIKTVRTEGFSALFKGYLPSVMKASLTSSLYFTFYAEACKRL